MVNIFKWPKMLLVSLHSLNLLSLFSESSGWCPKIYFNTKCYSGPFLSKWRLHNLPKSIGPGSVVSVMTTVITKLIASAYKSSRVLRELQLDGLPNPGMHQQVLKTK